MAWGNNWCNSQWPFWIPWAENITQLNHPTLKVSKPRPLLNFQSQDLFDAVNDVRALNASRVQRGDEGWNDPPGLFSGTFPSCFWNIFNTNDVECTIQKVKGPCGHDHVVRYKLQSSIAAIHEVFLAFSHFFCWGDWRVVAARPDLGICSTVVLVDFFQNLTFRPKVVWAPQNSTSFAAVWVLIGVSEGFKMVSTRLLLWDLFS